MPHNFKKSTCATFIIVFLAFSASEAPAKDNGPGPSKTDIINICFNVAEVCHDACDKAALTGTEWNICDRGCDSNRDACVAGAGRQGSAAGSKIQTLPKNMDKKFVPTN